MRNRSTSRFYCVSLCAALAVAGCAEMVKFSSAPAGRSGSPTGTVAQQNRAPSGKPAVVLGTASGAPGETVSFSVSLYTAGATVAGAQNDLSFDPVNTPVAGKGAGKPQCAVNPAIDKGATAFAFRPPKCGDGSCRGLRALVLSVTDLRPIADGSVLYTCAVRIPPTAKPGTYPLVISGVALSTPDGRVVPGATGVSGAITVSAPR